MENWGILREIVLRKRKTIHLFSAATKEAVTESETFFRGMACDDFSAEAVFAEPERMFWHDAKIDEKKGTFLFDSNVDVRKETFLRNTMLEEKDESSLYYPHVSSEDRGEIVPLSGSDSKVVCPQEFFAGVDHRGSLVFADHFLFGASLNLSAVDCVVRAGTTKLFPTGLSERCKMEADTAGLLSSGPLVDSPDAKSQMAVHIPNGVLCSRCIQSNEEASASRGASTAGTGGRKFLRGAT